MSTIHRGLLVPADQYVAQRQAPSRQGSQTGDEAHVSTSAARPHRKRRLAVAAAALGVVGVGAFAAHAALAPAVAQAAPAPARVAAAPTTHDLPGPKVETVAYDVGSPGGEPVAPAYGQTLQEFGNFSAGNPDTQGIYNSTEGFINGNYGISSGEGYYGYGTPSSIYNYNQSYINSLYGISSGYPYGTPYQGANPQSEYNYTQSYLNQLYSEFGP